jgi:hypothetical protein
MTGSLFRCRKPRSPERSSFRPELESLESREVPSSAQVSAAFNQLTTDMTNLQASLAARPVNTGNFNTNLTAVGNDMLILAIGAPGFVPADRLRIDGALYSNGWVLIFDGYSNIGLLPTPQFINIVEVGVGAVQQGFLDGSLTSSFPSSSGSATLM